jgi:putative YjhG/YagF family dehydratase
MIDPGLCAGCLYRREVRSDKGAVFTLCRRGLNDSRYPKYPRIPVLRCAGFDPIPYNRVFPMPSFSFDQIVESDPAVFDIRSKAKGPQGRVPITAAMLLERPSGDLFGWAQNAGMGWNPAKLGGKEILILSTHGGIRRPDGTPVALGYHTGHWEVGLLMEAAAEELSAQRAIPFAAYCTDPCDGRTQGTPGMFDSLPYRNDAATIFRRQIRSLPTRSGVIGVATCDKGLPAMMMALAGTPNLPCVLVPGGTTLLAEEGEDAGRVQSVGARFAHNEITLEEAADALCRSCASPGGGCQFLGTAATSQVVGEAMGMSLTHSALAPSGQAVWLDMARRSARAVLRLESAGLTMNRVLTDASIANAMIVHAAFGGSTNLILHVPAIAHAAGLRRPTAADWTRINREIPRIVDALPNGPRYFPTVQVFMAGGVPEVMLHLRRAGLLDTNAMTVSGENLGTMLDWWEQSERRQAIRKVLRERDGVDPDQVIMDPDSARRSGLTSTVTFPVGNLAPGGSVIKSTSIDPSIVDADGIYRKRGPARVFRTELGVIAAIKSNGTDRIKEGDVIVLICRGPMGSGMEEIYQITAALKHLSFGKHVAVLTDARFSGVSTGACIGHITPEALAGGPIGKVLEGDLIEITIDRNNLTGGVNLIGAGGNAGGDASVEAGDRLLAERDLRPDLEPDPGLPADSRLWAALQNASGGTWGGCVFDVDAITERLASSPAPDR